MVVYMWKKTAMMALLCLMLFRPMEVQASGGEILWQDMDTVEKRFETLFPEYQFDGKQVLSLILQGDIKGAVTTLVRGLTGMVKAQFQEIRTLFVMVLQFCGYFSKPAGIGYCVLFYLPAIDRRAAESVRKRG